MRKWRKSIRDFNFDIGWDLWPRYRQLSEKAIRVGWESWNCCSTNREWVCNVHRWLPVSGRRTKEDWVVRAVFLGFYVEWLPNEYFVHSRKDEADNKDRADNIVPLFPNPFEQPWILEDAEFEIAPEESEFDILVIAKDGSKYEFIAKDAIQLSQSGGKGPDRLRAWIARVWFFREYVEKPNKLGKMSYHSQPDDSE